MPVVARASSYEAPGGVVVEVGGARLRVTSGFDGTLLAPGRSCSRWCAMIPSGVQVFVALGVVDMRYGVERLSGIVREQMGYEPRGGALFVFVGGAVVSS